MSPSAGSSHAAAVQPNPGSANAPIAVNVSVAAFDGTVQLVFAVVVAAAGLVLALRHECLDGWSVR